MQAVFWGWQILDAILVASEYLGDSKAKKKGGFLDEAGLLFSTFWWNLTWEKPTIKSIGPT